MRDEDYAYIQRVAQVFYKVKEGLDLSLTKRGSRLVKDEQLRLYDQSAHNLHKLLLARA